MKTAFLLAVWLAALGAGAGAPPPDDADLYYRRTHGGASPPAGFNPGDHPGETADSAPAGKPLAPVPAARLLDHGVDPANLGQGDWLWQMNSCISALGVADVQGVINYEKARGMKWITVKCGDSTNIWSQFNTDLVTRAHAAGLKIFGWAYAYGNNVPGEINVALHALSLGADGFIIDAESEYETLPNNSAAATQYCQGIRAVYPNTFLAHAPFPIISSHPGFPYVAFGRYCDAVMPQAYWADIGGVNYAAPMVARMNTEWRNWQNSLTGTNTNAIKPLAPIGQGYHSVNGAVSGAAIATFVNALKTNTPSATAGGYRGVSFWSCQHHSVDMWSALGALRLGLTNEPPAIVTPSLARSVDAGAGVVFSFSAIGTPPLRFQWRLNGTNLPAATNATYARVNAQAAHAGGYAVVVTNSYGSFTGLVATLVVNTPRVWQTIFADDFETNSGARWNLFDGSGNGTPDYTAQWAYDHGADQYTFNGVLNVIPPAPNSVGGSTRALKLTVNKNDGIAATAGVSLYPKNVVLAGNHALRFDVWLNYNGPAGGGIGSTEYATFGLNHAGTRVNWGGATAGSSDGLWFAMNGEGGAARDYLAYAGAPPGPPELLSFAAGGLGTGGAQGDNASADAFFLALFPTPTYETPGSPGKRWVQGEVSQLDGLITWRLNGVIIAQRTNTSPFTSGTAMIGYMDTFTSLASPAADNFALFDNVRVLTPVIPPSLTSQPTNRVVNAGGNATFHAGATGSAPLAYRWRFNGANLPSATNAIYLLTNTQPSHAGAYSVVITNAAGTVTSTSATLSVTVLRIAGFVATNGGWRLTLAGAPGPGYLVERSADLLVWSPVVTLTNITGLLNFDLPANPATPQLFLRVSAPK